MDSELRDKVYNVIHKSFKHNENEPSFLEEDACTDGIMELITQSNRALIERIRSELSEKVFIAGYNNGLMDVVSEDDVTAVLTELYEEMK